MRTKDTPLPGDLVVRCRKEPVGPLRRDVYSLFRWPEQTLSTAGPYQSYRYALSQAKQLNILGGRIWRDHAKTGAVEQLEDVTV